MFVSRLARSVLLGSTVGCLCWTAPVVGESTFAFVGDYGNANNAEAAVAAMIHDPSWSTDYVVTLGDNNYGRLDVGHAHWELTIGQFYGDFIRGRVSPAAYPSQTSPVQRFFPTVGNHDSSATGSGFGGSNGGIIPGYVDYFHTDPDGPGRLPSGVHNSTHSYYDVELPIDGGNGTVHLFSMDSDSFKTDGSSRAAQETWLEQGLTNSTATWKFVFFHHAPYSSSGVHGSDPAMQLPFQQWGVDAVLSGHDHLYERLLISDASQTDMLYLVNGLGGRSIYPFLPSSVAGSAFRFNDEFGSLRLRATDLQAVFEFHSVDEGAGNLEDRFTLTRSGLFVDLDGDGQHGCGDIDALSAALLAGSNDLAFDVNGDLQVTADDRTFWIEQVAGTEVGDADLSGTVTASQDGAALLAHLGQPGSVGWCDGDFSGDGQVTAATDGALLLSNLSLDQAAAVPEPASALLLMLGLSSGWLIRRLATRGR